MTKVVVPDTRHAGLKDDIARLVEKYSSDLPGPQQLAVAAQVVGMMIGLQDPRAMTTEMAMTIVHGNIVEGNQQVQKQLNPEGKTRFTN